MICVSVPLQQRLQEKWWHDFIREGQCACVPSWYNGDQVHAGSIVQAGPQKVSFLTWSDWLQLSATVTVFIIWGKKKPG